MRIRIATCQYPIDFLSDQSAWRTKVSELVSRGAEAGASLLMFPEYASLELASLLPAPIRGDLRATLTAMQTFCPSTWPCIVNWPGVTTSICSPDPSRSASPMGIATARPCSRQTVATAGRTSR